VRLRDSLLIMSGSQELCLTMHVLASVVHRGVSGSSLQPQLHVASTWCILLAFNFCMVTASLCTVQKCCSCCVVAPSLHRCCMFNIRWYLQRNLRGSVLLITAGHVCASMDDR
jgi:hypothetical protein